MFEMVQLFSLIDQLRYFSTCSTYHFSLHIFSEVCLLPFYREIHYLFVRIKLLVTWDPHQDMYRNRSEVAEFDIRNLRMSLKSLDTSFEVLGGRNSIGNCVDCK
ncbi:hypothetical protein Syun_014651 [Stephania yunnanensis]|uniref:Uncharacterized protein n=1 Tax=Stephania yunnanensis TaxID=152371 RepID=A0AAP0JJR1_9MAGN